MSAGLQCWELSWEGTSTCGSDHWCRLHTLHEGESWQLVTAVLFHKPILQPSSSQRPLRMQPTQLQTLNTVSQAWWAGCQNQQRWHLLLHSVLPSQPNRFSPGWGSNHIVDPSAWDHPTSPWCAATCLLLTCCQHTSTASHLDWVRSPVEGQQRQTWPWPVGHPALYLHGKE